VMGGFIDLRSESPEPETPLMPVEMPELDNGPHFFYGLQWWFFGALAVFGFGYLAYDEWRRARDEKTKSERPLHPAVDRQHHPGHE
jgi:cytochrome oxidase assembly protein ShyY1